ncbi:MAG: amino acid permease [Woeseiaceae bacterium]|nr:amino acid permease [Woeseiaceae bacterium]
MATQKAHLIRGIGAIGGSFLVLNGMIGAGIFALPSVVAERAGVLSPWLFVAAGLLIIMIVLAFAELGSYFRESGGPALYAARAFGPVVGFGTGWLYYVSRISSMAGNSHVIATYLGTFYAWFDTTLGHNVVVVALISALTFINVLGVKDSIRALSMFTFFKVIPLLILIILGLKAFSPDILFPETLPSIEDPGGTVLLLFYAFIGFEAIVMTAGETKNPRRVIPLTMVKTVLVITLLYFLIVLAYVLVLPDKLDSGATLADMAYRLAGGVGATVIALTAIFSIGGNLAGSMLAAPRLTLAMADERLLPGWFSRIHDKYSTPANSIVFYGVIAIAVAVSGTFVKLAIASTLTRIIVYSVSIAALPIIKRQADPDVVANAFKLKGGYTIPVIALGLCGWMAWHSSLESWIFVGQLLVVGLVLFGIEKLILGRNKSKH